MASKLKSLTKSDLITLIQNHNSVKSILESFGLSPYGGARKTFAQLVEKFNLDLSELKIRAESERSSAISRSLTINKDEFFVNGKLRNNNAMKKKLLQLGVKYQCIICKNNGEHCSKLLMLQLDHVDGNRYNNVISNLRFLCPNCHSQTDTFGYKNRKNGDS